ncbi:MAG: (d)CMP kinase [candidate division Zixibacteria bacterium]|nr:(d)CMP kinase [candidate division Zixibacteria bacterium]
MFVVAIDGPAGSGKTTTAKRVAAELGFRHLDTGAMYRALTWLAIQKQINLDDASALADLAQSAQISFSPDNSGGQLVSIAGQDVTEEIRSPEVSECVSQLSAHVDVRSALVARQRELAASDTGVVVEGRDIGTVVFPNADLKVFLVASIEERAQRRVRDFAADGVVTSVADQIELMMKRDLADSGRDASPLVEAKGAALIDTSKLSIDEQVDKVVSLARERMS